VGAAGGRGYPVNPEATITSFFPERVGVFQGGEWEGMTLRDLLTMSSGLEWDELSTSYLDPANDFNALMASPDPLGFLFAKPFVSPPGERFTYNSGVSVLLGEILRRATGQEVDAFAAETVFAQLEIQDFYWGRLNDGTADTGGALALRPRDMAKFGELVLRGGVWNGVRVLPSGWVEAATIQQAPDRGYGYQWWISNLTSDNWGQLPVVAAIGWGGQYIIVIPQLDLVCVLTGANHDDLTGQGIRVLKETFLPGLMN
jgi:CubicO group peptidase (beta-lactamase class C family)